ncbi:LytR/AlgR family response regulator transcription factor [Derxia gummosa]|uniref:LytR/AlgR family response regulator transcription factor n=1 Tax=Derxia gummosa DSM 723 TaxID=1121388 RepID=A0A8B6X0V2_9BURK|nr:LytTR family DNA-binding domain-containing protein [Derxia gummosa]
MRPLRLLLVDDEPLARSRLRILLEDLRSQIETRIVGEAANGREAITQIEELLPDVVLLDVQMPGMNGVEVARHAMHIRPMPGRHAPQIVFVTAFDDYAVQAFDVQAIDYLLKPVRSTRLFDALDRARKRCEEREAALKVSDPAFSEEALERAAAVAGLSRRHIAVTERGKLTLVPVLDILYFRAEMKYTTIRTRDAEYLTEESLTALEEEFGEYFVRVHRSALVARNAIAGCQRASREGTESESGDQGWQIQLRGLDETLPVSRRQWPNVKTLLRA